MTHANGLRFGRPGIVLPSSPLAPEQVDPKQVDPVPSCTIEVWLRPASVRGESTLLSFYGPSRLSHFSIRQSDADLLLKSDVEGSHPGKNLTKRYVDNFFRKRELVLLTISSGLQGTNIYADGSLFFKFAQFHVSPRIFADRFVFGTSLSQADTWSGELRGLAFYATELPPQRVLDHYRTWTSLLRPSIAPNDRAIAAYAFEEHSGAVVQNLAGSGAALTIPLRFQLVNQDLLSLPWREFQPDWSYWQDVLLNVFGFVPLGFVFCAYFACFYALRSAVMITILAGIVVTFTIEIVQSHLPTRSSDLTDVLTNICGACLGARLYAWRPLRTFLAAVVADIASAAPGRS